MRVCLQCRDGHRAVCLHTGRGTGACASGPSAGAVGDVGGTGTTAPMLFLGKQLYAEIVVGRSTAGRPCDLLGSGVDRGISVMRVAGSV